MWTTFVLIGALAATPPGGPAMPKAPAHATDVGELISRGIDLAIRRFKSQHEGERAYAFALIASPEGNGLICAFATEEGLAAVSEKYRALGYTAKRGDVGKALQVSLRWANPDDGWYYDFDSLKSADERIEADLQRGVRKLFDGKTEKLCLKAIADADRRKVFDSVAPRDGLVLGFTYGEDPADFVRFASQVNPPPLVRKLKAEVAAGYKEYDKLVPPPLPARARSKAQTR